MANCQEISHMMKLENRVSSTLQIFSGNPFKKFNRLRET